MIRRQDVWPLGTVAFVLLVTAAWWTLALWSVPGAPDWLERARSVCFNLGESGLPDRAGWLVLFGQPPAMFAALMVGWGREIRESVRHLVSSGSGRIVAAAVAGASIAGLSLAGARVVSARAPEAEWGAIASTSRPVRIDRPWPEHSELVDQRGEAFGLERLTGRPAFVTFAFGHCASICPAVVHQTLAAREELGVDWPVVVFTLDPWRDTPGRLLAVARHFGLDEARDHLVGGEVAEVEAALDAWGIARTRDTRTGDIVHAGLVYGIEADGTIAYAATGGRGQLVQVGTLLLSGGES